MFKSNTPPRSIAHSYIAPLVRVLVLTAFLATAVQSSADAANSITIYNNSGVRIDALYCVEEKYPGWAGDKLGNGYLNSGQWYRVTFSSARYVKVQVYFSNGRTRSWHNVDLTRYDRITINHT